MPVAVVLPVSQLLHLVVRGFANLNELVHPLFNCHINYLSCCVYMCMSIYEIEEDAIARDEKSPLAEGVDDDNGEDVVVDAWVDGIHFLL